MQTTSKGIQRGQPQKTAAPYKQGQEKQYTGNKQQRKSQHRRNSKQRNTKTEKRQKIIEEELAYLDISWWSSEDTPRQQKRNNGTKHSRVALRGENKEANQPVKKIWLALQSTQEWEAQQKILRQQCAPPSRKPH